MPKTGKQRSIGGISLTSIGGLIVAYGFAALSFNMAPFLVGLYVGEFGSSETTAGLAVTLELLGAALTAMILANFAEKLPHKKLICSATAALALLNILSAFIPDINTLIAMRVVAGIMAGLMITVVYYLIGISTEPTRLFGIATVANVFTAIIYLVAIPNAIDAWQAAGAFAIMALPVIPSLLMLSKFRMVSDADTGEEAEPARVKLGWLGFVFLFAALMVHTAQGGYYGYVELVGLSIPLDNTTIGNALAISYILGLVSSALTGYLGDRFGQLKPLAIGMAGHAVAVTLVATSSSASGYIIPVLMQSFFFFLLLPYMQGLAAHLDHSGHLPTLCGAIIMLALGLGPFVMALLVEQWGYVTIAYSVVSSVVIGYALMYFVAKNWGDRPQADAR